MRAYVRMDHASRYDAANAEAKQIAMQSSMCFKTDNE